MMPSEEIRTYKITVDTNNNPIITETTSNASERLKHEINIKKGLSFWLKEGGQQSPLGRTFAKQTAGINQTNLDNIRGPYFDNSYRLDIIDQNGNQLGEIETTITSSTSTTKPE